MYALSQTRKKNPAVCFLATATGDAPTYIAKFYAAFVKLQCRPTHVSFFERTPDLRKVLLAQDLIYVGGGNTKSMLAVWREWNLPGILRKAWTSGIVLAGISAGAICWFESGPSDSWSEHLAPLPCLGWLPGGCCPHYDGESERRPSLHRFVANSLMPTTLALDDGTAARFVGRTLKRVVCSRPAAKAYQVQRQEQAVEETALHATQLAR
jgi:peptidase E